MYMLQQRQFLEATSSGDGDVLAQGRGNHVASASTRSAALTPERRVAASTVSLPGHARAGVGRGVGAGGQLLLCTTPHDVDAHLVPANAS